MQINEVNDREKLQSIVVSILKEYGVKHNKDRKIRPEQKKNGKRLFGVKLHQLDLSDVILANGSVVQIPRFVADACNRILENVEVEGIFRKAGSSTRQKDIRATLESGVPLGRSHHVIDVANVLKFFIRELSEPLIPTTLQQTLLRSYLVGENRNSAILLTCLLLPSLEGNVLTFFMQFLLTISLSVATNKMSTENLAIIFTPSIMPCLNVNSARFNQHVKTVQFLIEQANSIGIVPEIVINKLTLALATNKKHSTRKSLEILDNVNKTNKHKRRSEIFTGLKKMVGSSRSNLVDLEETPIIKKNTDANGLVPCNLNENSSVSRSTKKKRKFADPIYTFSAKKKRDVQNTPKTNTPLSRKAKMPRRSLGGSRFMKSISHSINPSAVSVERRWSLVGPSWSKANSKYHSDETHINKKLPVIQDEPTDNIVNDDKSDVNDISSKSENNILLNPSDSKTNCKNNSSADNADDQRGILKQLNSSDDTQLALGLSHKLRIRCQEEDAKFKQARSPRVRKIGAPRNPERKLTRTQTWHISSSISTDPISHRNDTVPIYKHKSAVNSKKALSPQKLEPRTPKAERINNSNNASTENWTPADSFFTPAKFQSDMQVDTDNIKNFKFIQDTPFQTPKTPKQHTKINKSNNKDIMLPPNRLPIQKLRTPKNTPVAASSHLCENRLTPSTPSVDENGRASIARLRTQNAGMVMAKAKLFDGLVDSSTTSGVSSKSQVSRSAVAPNPRTKDNAFKKPTKDFSNIRK